MACRSDHMAYISRHQAKACPPHVRKLMDQAIGKEVLKPQALGGPSHLPSHTTFTPVSSQHVASGRGSLLISCLEIIRVQAGSLGPITAHQYVCVQYMASFWLVALGPEPEQCPVVARCCAALGCLSPGVARGFSRRL